MKICIIIRQLENNRPVTHTVIREPIHEVDNLESYFTQVAKDKIEDFKNQFVEFKKAVFYTDIVEI